MITLLDGFAPDVVAVRAEGQVTMQDYDKVLIPAVEKALTRSTKLKFYYEIGSDFTGMNLGAVFEDMRVGLGHLGRWARIAVVTDIDWIKRAVHLFKFLLPTQTKLFSLAQAADAKAWIAHEHID
jgi:SpoIIAA-like